MGSGGSKSPSPTKKAAPKLSEVEQGQITLMRQRDRLTKFLKVLDTEIDTCLGKAKEAKKNNRMDAAVRYVKLKLIKEKRRKDINTQIFNLETINSRIQEQLINIDTVKAMEAGNKVIQAIQAELPIERAQQIMEDTQDALEYVNEIDKVFNRELGADENTEAALEKELQFIEQMEEGNSIQPQQQQKNRPTPTTTTKGSTGTTTVKTASSSTVEDSTNYGHEFPEVPADRVTVDTIAAQQQQQQQNNVADRTRSSAKKIAVSI